MYNENYLTSMALSNLDFIAGVLTITPVIIGYLMGIITLRIYLVKRTNLVLLSSLLFFALTSPWLGVSYAFLSVSLGIGTPNHTTYVFIYAWSVPIVGTLWNYITASLNTKQPKLKYVFLGVFLILDVVYLYAIYALRQFDVHNVENSIFLDSNFEGVSVIVLYLTVLSVLFFIAPTYFWISKNTKEPLLKFKSRMISLGAVLYALVAIIDGLIPLTNLGALIVIRLLLLCALVCLYLGYNTPMKIKD
ncbi:MAG: hypothetical protein OEZ01_08610, partial [Candidatus Heimdallarchaeota archaeon]|nr:hypothetical protein [Candidatus Heimdallarchaeota archaeon]